MRADGVTMNGFLFDIFDIFIARQDSGKGGLFLTEITEP